MERWNAGSDPGMTRYLDASVLFGLVGMIALSYVLLAVGPLP